MVRHRVYSHLPSLQLTNAHVINGSSFHSICINQVEPSELNNIVSWVQRSFTSIKANCTHIKLMWSSMIVSQSPRRGFRSMQSSRVYHYGWQCQENWHTCFLGLSRPSINVIYKTLECNGERAFFNWGSSEALILPSIVMIMQVLSIFMNTDSVEQYSSYLWYLLDSREYGCASWGWWRGGGWNLYYRWK